MSSPFTAKVNSVVAAVEEYQRGSYNLAECKRRCDLTEAGYAVLFRDGYGVSQYSTLEKVREIAAKAVAAS